MMPTKFKIGEKLVYPNHGVVVVERIGESFVFGKSEVYRLRLLATNGIMEVPAGNAERIGLRRLYSGERMREVMQILSEKPECLPLLAWSHRYRQNQEKMRTGLLENIAEILRDLAWSARRKSLSFREKKMYDRAKYLLVSELAVVRSIPENEAEEWVAKALEAQHEKVEETPG